MGELNRRQRGVALVEMDHAGLDAERPQGPDPTHAEQHVLGQAGVAVGLVETGGDPPLERPVRRQVGVEQEQRHPADVDPPDLRGDPGVIDRDGDRHRLAVAAGHQRRRQPLRIGVHPVLVLPPGGIDALAEVPLAVHQPDRHEWQRPVRGFLQQVAGQRTQAAGVYGQRHVDAVLRAQERDRPGGIDRLDGGLERDDGGPIEIDGNRILERGRPLEQPRVGRRPLQNAGGRLLEQTDGVLRAQLKAMGVDRREQLGTSRRPRPAIVVGNPRQRRERPRNPLRELGGGASDVFSAVGQGGGQVVHGSRLWGTRGAAVAVGRGWVDRWTRSPELCALDYTVAGADRWRGGALDHTVADADR